MKDIPEEQANKELEEKAQKVRKKDLQELLSKRHKIEEKLRGNTTINMYIDKVKTMLSLIRDYRNGSYTAVPWKSIAAIAGALLYVLTPVDLIPDFIPVIGLLDDAGVLAACLKLVSDDLEDYAAWKAHHSSQTRDTEGSITPEKE